MNSVSPPRQPTTASAEELVRSQVVAARLASAQMTTPALRLLFDSVDRASSLPTRPGWERKAAAHAEIFALLGAVAGHEAAEIGRAHV